MAGLASRIAPERHVLGGEVLRVTVIVHGVACGGCCGYYDQPPATGMRGWVLATVPDGCLPGRVRAWRERGGAGGAMRDHRAPDGLVFLLCDTSSLRRRPGSAQRTRPDQPGDY